MKRLLNSRCFGGHHEFNPVTVGQAFCGTSWCGGAFDGAHQACESRVLSGRVEQPGVRNKQGAEMSSIRETAEQFFDACETGKGWEGCQPIATPGATFSSQTGALEGIDTLQGYTDWMKGLFTPVPDGQLRGSVIRGRRCAKERGRLRRIPRNAHRRGWTGAADRKEGGGRLRLRHGFRRRSNPSHDEDLERRDQPEAVGMGVRSSAAHGMAPHEIGEFAREQLDRGNKGQHDPPRSAENPLPRHAARHA